MPVPAAAPENLVLRLEIDRLHYHLGRSDHVQIPGLSVSRETPIVNTAYAGEVTTISPQPPPIAAPWTRAMVGAGNRRIACMTRARPRTVRCMPAGSDITALKSIPAQKALPAPARTTTSPSSRRNR